MVERHHHCIAPLCQRVAVKRRQIVSRTCREAAAVQPDEHRPTTPIADTGRPDIEAKAILALDAVVPLEDERLFVVQAPRSLVLRRHRTIGARAAYAAPGARRDRRAKAIRATRVGAIGYALEGQDTVLLIAGDAPSRRPGDRHIGARSQFAMLATSDLGALAFTAGRHRGRPGRRRYAGCDSAPYPCPAIDTAVTACARFPRHRRLLPFLSCAPAPGGRGQRPVRPGALSPVIHLVLRRKVMPIVRGRGPASSVGPLAAVGPR